MSTTRTLFFEEISDTSIVHNRDSIGRYPGGHSNASGRYIRITYRRGRYGQTAGYVFGDSLAGTPACPYHMPRNTNRFNDPRLFIPRKNARDFIEAKDLNALVDRIKLYNYVWEAEANNIYGYGGISGRANVTVDISRLSYINASSDGAGTGEVFQPSLNILDGRGGSNNITIPKRVVIYNVKGTSVLDVRNKLNNARDNIIENNIDCCTYGNEIQYGIPETLNGYFAIDTQSTTKVLNAGHNNNVGGKFIQATDTTADYKIMYTSGINAGSILKDSNGEELVFKSNIPYITTYRKDNEPTQPLQYTGFILYTINPLIELVSDDLSVTLNEKDITYNKGTYYIGANKYPHIKNTHFVPIKNVLKSYLNNIMVLAQTGLNNGVPDATTFSDISTFFANQAQQTTEFDKDNPDTSFVGYQANKKALIKLDFYNVLVDAYKLMVNSCICNSDCSCNLVCVCNTNCGCNYG